MDPRLRGDDNGLKNLLYSLMALSTLRRVTLNTPAATSFLSTERDRALHDLTQDAVFIPQQGTGPYDLALDLRDGRLVLEIRAANDTPLPSLILSMTPYRRLIRDYKMMIESYESTRISGDLVKLESIDMGRRGLHDEGAALLIERLSNKITIDHATARRLFTLICALAET
jgi:uncharacterized protein (UPF0262 family)